MSYKVIFYLNSRSDRSEFNVAETGVRIGILVTGTGAVGFVVQPGHLTSVARTSPHGHGQDHAPPHALRHSVRNASLRGRLAEMAAETVRQRVVAVKLFPIQMNFKLHNE